MGWCVSFGAHVWMHCDASLRTVVRAVVVTTATIYFVFDT